MNLFSNTIQSLNSALDYSSLKQKTISNNIANADTPNYKAKEAVRSSFQSQLDTSLQAYRTNERHFTFPNSGAAGGRVAQKADVQYNNDGNSVDVDQEMSELAANQIYYNALSETLSGKFQSLQNVIRGGE